MKAIQVTEPYKLEIVEVPKPEIQQENEVLIRVTSGGICGSDIGIYNGSNSLATYPRIIGHEFGGVVEAVGKDVTKLKAGDLVAVDPVRSCGCCSACKKGRHNVCSTLEVVGVHRDGGFAEYIVAPESDVYVVDAATVDPAYVCLVEPYSIGEQVNARAQIAEGDKVLVMGSGPIGIAVMQVAKGCGAVVMMTDLLDERLARAADMGADIVVNVKKQSLEEAVAAFTDGEGMPVVVDSVCNTASFEQALDLAAPAGRVVLLGLGNKPSNIPSVAITKKELDVLGSRLNRYRFPQVIEGFEKHIYTPEKMCSSSYHFLDVEKAIKQITEHPELECKVTLNF